MQKALYYAALALLFTHELDAMTHSEWRILFLLRALPDDVGRQCFVLLHVPLFFLVLWLSVEPSERVRDVSRAVFAGFLPIHAVLHFAMASSPEHTFTGLVSNLPIFGAGAFGLGYLLLRWLSPSPNSKTA